MICTLFMTALVNIKLHELQTICMTSGTIKRKFVGISVKMRIKKR